MEPRRPFDVSARISCNSALAGRDRISALLRPTASRSTDSGPPIGPSAQDPRRHGPSIRHRRTLLGKPEKLVMFTHSGNQLGKSRLNRRSANPTPHAMQAFVGNLIQRKARALSPEFKHALAREVLKTEGLRISAPTTPATVVAAGLTTADAVAPAILDRIWRGHFPVLYLLAGYVGFVLFEASVLALVSRQLKRDLDVPRVRR